MACNPQIAERIRARAERGDWEFLFRCFSRVPDAFAFGMLRDYFERLEPAPGTLESDRRRAANRWIEETACAMFPAKGATYTATDAEIGEMAEQAAARVKERIAPGMPYEAKRAALDAICAEFGISVAHVKAGKPWVKLCRRIDGARWWRRHLRGRFRVIEHAAIRAGMVSERCPYISRMGMQRFEQEQRRALRFLETMEMVCMDSGEVVALSDVVASNVSSPKNRFTEQVTKLKGMEAAAAVMGFTAHFVTWTCPSRMHARRTVSKGKTARNPKYDGTRPDTAQAYLNILWARTRAQLKREGIERFGWWCTEPHEDGTPHRHFAVFVKAGQEAALYAAMRKHALTDEPDEPGAQEHRITFKRCDPAQGSAVGYMMKYIAKNVDGKHVGEVAELPGIDSTESAPRAVAWARRWGIRQFQSFGTANVTVWRMARKWAQQRAESLQADLARIGGAIGPAILAAHAGDWNGYMQAQSTPGTRLRPLVEIVPSQTYPGELVRRVVGVVAADGAHLVMKDDRWEMRIKPEVRACRMAARGALAFPRTRGNNCTRGAQAPPRETWIPSEIPPDEVIFDAGGVSMMVDSVTGDPFAVIAPGFQIGEFKDQRPTPEEARALYVAAKAQADAAFNAKGQK